MAEKTAEEIAKEKADATPPPTTVSQAVYDAAIAEGNKSKESITTLQTQIAELQKANVEKQKTGEPDKYLTNLEADNERLKLELEKGKTDFETFKTESKEKDVDRKKLGAFWDLATADGMQRDKDLLKFIDKKAIQIDEAGVVNEKSVQSELNRLKKNKPYFFGEKVETINDGAPGEGEEKDAKTFAQQGLQIFGLTETKQG